MSAQWVRSSIGLPHEGESVEFVLDGREVPLAGTYLQQTFRSRWWGYETQRVRTWRPADMDSPASESELAHSATHSLAHCD